MLQRSPGLSNWGIFSMVLQNTSIQARLRRWSVRKVTAPRSNVNDRGLDIWSLMAWHIPGNKPPRTHLGRLAPLSSD